MAKHNWPALRRRFFQGEWITLEAMAQAEGIKAGYLRGRAAKEKWGEKRAIIEREAEAKANERLSTRLAREAERRLPGWLAHWVEMHSSPTKRINRPRQIYTGPTERKFVPIEQR